jgi:hypothetical protein
MGCRNHLLQLRKRNAFSGFGKWHSIDPGNGTHNGGGFVIARQSLVYRTLFEQEREPHKTDMLVEAMKSSVRQLLVEPGMCQNGKNMPLAGTPQQ